MKKLILVCLGGSLLTVASIRAAEPPAARPTAEDEEVQRELSIARPEMARINGLLGVEMSRLLAERPSKPSPEVAALLNHPSIERPELGDTGVALHVRLIERARLGFVGGINLAKASAVQCGDIAAPNALIDAHAREQSLKSMKCQLDKMTRYETGVHKLNKSREESALALKLPEFSREALLTEARAATAEQDAQLQSTDAPEKAKIQAFTEFVKFVDAHSSTLHVVNHQLMFENDADTKAANELLSRATAPPLPH